MARNQFLNPRSQAGQAIVLIALMIVVLFGAIGLAVDAGLGYYYNNQAERAASAAALAGVLFMPNQFTHAQAIPAGTRNDASDRVQDEARRNGFDWNDVADGVTVTPAAVPGSTYKLQVTVTRTVHTFFMQLFGVSTFTVSRTAQAGYLPPITLGQPGGQLGATLPQMGTAGHGFVMDIESWANPRSDGDAYSTNPGASTDVHAFSVTAGTEPSDPTLPDRGGYNYLVNIPAAGGRIQVYNAGFAPDYASPHNHCDNHKAPIPAANCSPAPASNYYSEEYLVNEYTATNYSAIRYTLFQVNNPFIRSADVKLTQMTILPFDATNFTASPPTYCKITPTYTAYPACTGSTKITQTFDALGNPTNMLTFHYWSDIATYTGAADGGLVTLNTYVPTAQFIQSGNVLLPGTYRLRMDTLNYDGSVPTAASVNYGTHSYAVQVLDNATGNPCLAATPGCNLSGWKDMCLFTTIQAGSFDLSLFNLPVDYAGKTVSVWVYDPGDILGSGNVTIALIDPTTGLTAVAPVLNIYDTGNARSNAPTLVSSTGSASILVTSGGVGTYNGHWLDFEVPVSAAYTGGATGWWNLRYTFTGFAGYANDALSFAVGLKGNPTHLISS